MAFRSAKNLLACVAALSGCGVLFGAPQPCMPLSPREQRVLALQISLDRRGFSCNTLDGQCGRKTQVALATYCAVNGLAYVPGAEATAHARFFAGETNLFETVVVTAADHAACGRIPAAPAEKAQLATMGYESLAEMFAERGHCSVTLLRRLNPALAWPNPPAGARVVLPRTTPVAVRGASRRFPLGEASVLRVSLARLEITAFDAAGRMIGLFPCSIAAEKSKRPPAGEVQVTALVPKPNYTYTAPRAGRAHRAPHLPARAEQPGWDVVDRPLPAHLRHPRHALPRADRPRGVAWLLPPRELERGEAPRHVRRRHKCRHRIALQGKGLVMVSTPVTVSFKARAFPLAD